MIGKKVNEKGIQYFIDDGEYGLLKGFKDRLNASAPQGMYGVDRGGETSDAKKVHCIVWGPTCDAIDKVFQGDLPTDLEPGKDWIVFRLPRFDIGGVTEVRVFRNLRI